MTNTFITDVASSAHVSVETDAAVTALEDAILESELGFRLATADPCGGPYPRAVMRRCADAFVSRWLANQTLLR